MRLAAAAVRPLARVWAGQAGAPFDGAVRFAAARAALALPGPAAAALACAAWALRWLAPLLVLGVPRRLDRLDAGRAGRVLERLQRAGWPPARAAFLLVKSVCLPACYGRRAAP